MNSTTERRVIYRFENVEEGVDLETVDVLDCNLRLEAVDEVRPPDLLPKKEGFFRRHLRLGEDDTGPGWFDWLMGVFLPIFCFTFDPGIFRNTWMQRDGLFTDLQLFAYTLVSISILTMIAWFLFGKRVGWLAPWIAGIFFSASLVSFAIGAILLPISVLGLIVLIGFLGFTPLFFSRVYFRGGMSALRLALSQSEKGRVAHIVAFSAMMSLAIPIIAQKHLGPSLKSFLSPYSANQQFDD